MRNAFALRLAASLASVGAAQVTLPTLDLSSLGHVAIAGEFSDISVYRDTQQLTTLSGGAFDSLYSQSSDGSYANLGVSDGTINAVCALNSTGTQTIFVAGNFSRIGTTEAVNIVSYNPTTKLFSPLSSGVMGTVQALYCDNANNQVYIGGDFEMSNSTNAALWEVADQRFDALPFGGFDGPVSTITANGSSLLFGGKFDSVVDGVSSSSNEPQQINLQTAYVTSENPYNLNAQFSDPNNIVCPSGQDGPDTTWLLADNQAGSWSASLNFTFRPTSIRIYNTHYGGRGTREFRFIAEPINGILNLTYTDPSTGQEAYCDALCPLSDSSDIVYQDFKFVNVIEMNAFSLAISSWYGSGGGFRGIELFTDDIYAYAIDAFNEPTCANGTYKSASSQAGSWSPTIIDREPGYLSANLSGLALSTSSVTFEPQISQRGNYSIRIYTPGCLLDQTCSIRGGVELSVYTQAGLPATNVSIFQTNNFDKYDTLFQGLVEPGSDSFRPRVVLQPLAGQSGSINTVASRVQFLELSAIGSSNLNGLYDYEPSTYSATTVTNSTLEQAGAALGFDASVSSIIPTPDVTYVAGNFTSDAITNILMLEGGSAMALAGSGLNAPASSMLLSADLLYIGGNFTALTSSTVAASYAVAYNTTSRTWVSLGAGLNGPVSYVFRQNGTIGFSGSFNATVAYGAVSAKAARGSAFWNLATSSWAQSDSNLDGSLTSAVSVAGSTYLGGNIIRTYQLAAPGVASLITNGTSPQLTSIALPVLINNAGTTSSVNTGSFYNSSTKSLTIVAGSFMATDSAGSTINNVAFLSSNGTITGLPVSTISNDSVVYASHVDGQSLLLGGSIAGAAGTSTLGGLLIYDLESNALSATQPAALQGTDVRVNSITSRPGVAQIVVAGNFDSAGSLTCPALCVLDKASTTWQRPAIGLSGNVSSSTWLGQNILLLAGNMTLNGTAQYLATFDFSSQTFSPITQSLLPGPASVAVSDTNSTDSIYVAGQSTTGTAYLTKWDGNATQDLSTGLGPGSQIYDLQFVPLARSSGSENSIINANRNLLVLGLLNLTGNGTVAGALFDGVSYTPYLLANTGSNQPGSVRTLFSEQLISFSSQGSGLARGVVVVIALAIALFITFLLIAFGILAAFLRRRREGYRPASQTMAEKPSSGPPPQSLFSEENFQSHKGGRPPKV